MSSPPTENHPDEKEQQRAFLSNFDLFLIHRILLTDPSAFSSLTASGRPRQSHTPSYDEFNARTVEGGDSLPLSSSFNNVPYQIERTMRQAHRAYVVDSILREGDVDPLRGLTLELHASLRALVPRRTDLHHSVLRDEEVAEILPSRPTSFSTSFNADEGRREDAPSGATGRRDESQMIEALLKLLSHLIKAGGALSQLESEDRSRTTELWMRMAQKVISGEESWAADSSGEGSADKVVDFAVGSVTYLLFKAQMCQSDIDDFKLGHVYAPRIKALGPDFEREAFQARHGPFDGSETAPATRAWVRRFVSKCNKEELMSSKAKRIEAIKGAGWVDDILFHAATEGRAVVMPEVLAMDAGAVRDVREATRMAVAGSALALHACNCAGVGESVLRVDGPLPLELEGRRTALIQAMANKSSGNQEGYEEGVAETVVDLARALNSPLDASAVESLKSRTTAVLRGTDPVIKLLDARVKDIFRKMMLWELPDDALPTTMKTGRSLAKVEPYRGLETPDESNAFALNFVPAARGEFTTRGFSFYAPDLTRACLMASKVSQLMCTLFGSVFLDRLIIEACSEATVQ